MCGCLDNEGIHCSLDLLPCSFLVEGWNEAGAAARCQWIGEHGQSISSCLWYGLMSPHKVLNAAGRLKSQPFSGRCVSFLLCSKKLSCRTDVSAASPARAQLLTLTSDSRVTVCILLTGVTWELPPDCAFSRVCAEAEGDFILPWEFAPSLQKSGNMSS